MRTTLIQNLVGLILLTAGAILLVTVFGATRSVRSLSRSLIEQKSELIEAELRNFFRPIEIDLLMFRDWGEAGLIDPGADFENLNRIFIPPVERSGQVSSLMVANSNGQEYMLLRRENDWLNRRTDTRAPPEERSIEQSWSLDLVAAAEQPGAPEYDPTIRPWYRGALALVDEDHIHWTEPYEFFTTKDPGITASAKWARGDVTFVIAFDVLLRDLSEFTGKLHVSPNGRAVVFTEDETIIGLPRDERIASLNHALVHWNSKARSKEDPVTASFSSDGESWWAGFRRFPLGPERTLWIAVTVPEDDLLGEVRRQRNQIIGITLVSLAIAVIMAFFLDRRMRRRLAKAVQEAKQLGQYTLESKLGEGGMGTVYRATHAMLRRPTAIKLLRADRDTGAEALARFEREVRLTSKLTHPNTIAVYDYGRTPEGVFYYAMEYLQGVDLEKLVARRGRLPPGRVIHVLTQVCGSLAEAHAVGLIHRDIKPANIVLCPRGGLEDVVKVLDFGLVKEIRGDEDQKLTQKNMVTGTPNYVSPEAIVPSGKVDPRSDLYGVGAVGYYLLTGKRVFEATGFVEVLSKHLKDTPVRPSERIGVALPRDLEDLILRCLEKPPEKRPANAAELRDSLGRCSDAHAWTQQDARRWWADAGTELRETVSEPSGIPSDTSLTVDLRRRSHPGATEPISVSGEFFPDLE